MRLTHDQRGGLIGATRERITIALGELADRGLLTLRRGRVLVRDRDALAAFADCGGRSPSEGDT